MKKEILVDVRWLEAPEPLERAMQALDTLLPGQRVRMLIHREPLPLYGLLETQGFHHQTHLQPDGTYEILITQA
jgi:Uncharacterized conserved protein (DUF2249)